MAESVASLTVTPTVAHANATVKVNNVTVASGEASGAISLNVGSNSIVTVVTDPDGTTTKTYTVNVTRAGFNPAFDPALIKVMEKAEIFDTKPFEGDVDVNANGQWIAASQHGVFLSLGSPVSWQEVLTAGGGSLVNSNTLKIQCRISDSGSWVVISRAGIYRNSAANPYLAETVSNVVGINNVYDVDMSPNGNWIASSSQGTWRFLASTGTAGLVLASGSSVNGSPSARRIVKIRADGEWVIITSSGVYK